MVRLSETSRPMNESVERPAAGPLLWGVRVVLVGLGLVLRTVLMAMPVPAVIVRLACGHAAW